ncbi:hypothetical protein [Vibrio vulnificus]|uniref:hypothetical protein n=1 Tax=Vibrio vulnificus TaxID=672 RepID=UPI001CDBF007|nr:hypothetical protein [Vibrio vulnificus]MCA3950715.1 hypothetical protein [Vibrio vulnificus]
MRLDINNFIVFFVLVSMMYVFSPVISAIFFSFVPEGLLEFTTVGLVLMCFVIVYTLMFKRYCFITPPYINGKISIVFGILLLFTLVSFLIAIYGSLEGAILKSYNSRTGVNLSGLVGGLYYPLVVVISGYISLVMSDFLFFKNIEGRYRYLSAFLAISLLLVFLGSGNRNIVLWSLSLPISLYVGSQSNLRVIMLVSAMIFISVIMAAMRNNGFGSISSFSFPEFEYWNPIVHEYGTTYRVYDLIVNMGNRIYGYDTFGQSYLDTIINLLPSFLKPEGFVSFSDSLSSQYGIDGEGLGNSPIAEVIYNGYFPAVILQVMPFLVITLLIHSKLSSFLNRYLFIVKVAMLGCFFIASFNFWRIGNAELSKIMLSYCFGVVISYFILTLGFRKGNR